MPDIIGSTVTDPLLPLRDAMVALFHHEIAGIIAADKKWIIPQDRMADFTPANAHSPGHFKITHGVFPG